MINKNSLSIILLNLLVLAILPIVDVKGQHLEVEGDIDLKGYQIINLADPTNDLDAATKQYVDEVVLQSFRSIFGNVQAMLDDGVDPLAIVRIGIPMDSLYGKSYRGGLIFYLDDQDTLAGIKGMVAATMDQSSNAIWGCSGTAIDGADATAIGAGQENTTNILAGCITSDIAARICDNLDLNGFTDWFLPSLEELEQMYLKIGYGASAPSTNIGDFHDWYYWSSTEANSNSAIALRLLDGSLATVGKSGSFYLRAVRAF